jgi:hypothetical protein
MLLLKKIVYSAVAITGLLSVNAEKKPAEILNLDRWKITLPYSAKAGEDKPLEIFQPQLKEFENPSCFFVNEAGDGVVFRANCTAVTTKKSNYPRSELREMEVVKEGEYRAKTQASWAVNDGKSHTMTINQAITSLPPVKPHVVSAQIHDAKDDLMMVRLEGTKLFVERNKIGDVMIDENYKLGTRFDLVITAQDKHVKLWYNGALKMDWEVDASGCYFKAGCYTQSNSTKGDKPESFGEVVIYKLEIEHK